MRIIIPAYNEALVISMCLEALLMQRSPGRMSIVVVANGCTDATAEIARSWIEHFEVRGHVLEVIELPQGNKPAALNAGDRGVEHAPRVYLDADVVLSPNTMHSLLALLHPNTEKHFAAPKVEIARAYSCVTRSYAKVWSALPYIRDGAIGVGCYAVSAEGRTRWGEFPPILSDDKFVRLQFAPHERSSSRTSICSVHMPEGLLELVRIRGRWSRGNAELETNYPALKEQREERYRAIASMVAFRPALWLHLPAFVLVSLLGRLAAYRHSGVGLSVWERAATARRRQAGMPSAEAVQRDCEGGAG